MAKIELFEDGKVVEVHEPGAAPATWSVKRRATPGSHFYFVKVTQTDGDMLWSAPVWVPWHKQRADAITSEGIDTR